MSQRNPSTKEINILAAEYVAHGSQLEAFKSAFPKSKATDKTLAERASKTFKLSNICTRIEELKEISKNNSDKEFTMSVSALKKILTKAMKAGMETGKIAAVVSAVREFNCMDGNHSPIKTQEIEGNEMTPWGSVTSGLDKFDEKDKFDEE